MIEFDWNFLEKVLKKVDFQDHMVKIIMQYVTMSSLPIIWNREKLKGFRPSQEIR